jgi:hypothetical protein
VGDSYEPEAMSDSDYWSRMLECESDEQLFNASEGAGYWRMSGRLLPPENCETRLGLSLQG